VVDTATGTFIPPDKRRLGMVFQSYALWPHMNVEQHIAYPLRKQGVPKSEHGRKIANVMQTIGLPAVLERRPSQLSGGQQQRVALARALVSEPPVLLLDEPLSNLDATLRTQLRRELRQLHERLGTTTVLVTHDQEEASALADIIALMHQGKIIQLGTASEIFDRPRTRFVAEFVGFDNFVPGHIKANAGERALIALASGQEFEVMGGDSAAAEGAEVLVAARSDSLLLHAAAEAPADVRALTGTVRHVAKLGRGVEYEIAAGDCVVVVQEAADGAGARFRQGAEVSVDFLRSRSLVVSPDPD